MRLIESNKVIPLVRLILMNHPKADAICENMQKLVDIHTIEAEPVKHGRWVLKERAHYFKCSLCNEPIPYKFGYSESRRYYNYCPNCGAYMRGETE